MTYNVFGRTLSLTQSINQLYVCNAGVHSACGTREPTSGVVCDASLLRVPGTSPQARHDVPTHPSSQLVWKVRSLL